MAKLIVPRAESFSEWYTSVVLQSKMADYSPVRGCMVIRPHGYALWENMQGALDGLFKETGHVNAYFPVFIPKSFLAREAEHVEGFAKECAIVTHSRLKAVERDGARTVEPDPESRLEEELVVRPTSETVIHSMFAKWIQSYRDLPLLLNQWCNVVRWEMRTRLFLRTTEFLWQEGHTAHATEREAEEEALLMVDVYRRFAEEWLAVPVLFGLKSDAEKFAGAVRTYCIEALMQDGKALQAGTSHDLGQNFSKAFDVKYQTEKGDWQHVWNTSWGSSWRLIGALIMAHADDDGLVLPPRVAPIQVVLVPIWKGGAEIETIRSRAEEIGRALAAAGVRFHFDSRENQSPGFKFAEWELAGVPLRLELGPKDLAAGQVMAVRRQPLQDSYPFQPASKAKGSAPRASPDGGGSQPKPRSGADEAAGRPQRAKEAIALEAIASRVPAILKEIQDGMLERARSWREARTRSVDEWDEFRAGVDEGGFQVAHWCGEAECEAAIKAETSATIRVMTRDGPKEHGACIRCGKPSSRRVHFAVAY